MERLHINFHDFRSSEYFWYEITNLSYYRKKEDNLCLAHSGPRTSLTLDGLCNSAKVEGLFARCFERGGCICQSVETKDASRVLELADAEVIRVMLLQHFDFELEGGAATRSSSESRQVLCAL
jgi:hypothetical protein